MRILDVRYIKEYKIKVFFSDKKTKIIDLEDLVKNSKGIFIPLRNLDYFKKVALDDCHLSICWPNGADICPDLLYKMGKESPRKTLRKSRTRRRKKQTA